MKGRYTFAIADSTGPRSHTKPCATPPELTFIEWEITGNLVHRHDKLAGQHRTILASMDVAKLLRQFAIQCVLDVIRLPALKHNRDLHKDLPIEYLTTGGIESKRIPAINALNSYMVPIPEEDHILVLSARAAMNIAMDVCPTYAAKRIVHYAGRARKFALPEEKTFEWQKMQRDKFNQMIHTAFEDLCPNEEGE